MEGKRSNAAAVESTTITSDDASAADQIRRCLRDARKLEEKRRNDQLPLPPKIRDELLEESFPKLRPEEGMAKELTAEEFVALQTGLGNIIRSDMKKKMVLLQDQLSEYHSILEEVIALKSRCERLEQDKKDLVSFYRRACQDRDHKIMLLENELARSRCCSSSSDEASSVIGSGSEGRYYLHSHDHFLHYHHSQELSALVFFPSRMPPGISNDHCHHYHYHNESARMIQPSPSSVSDPRGNISSLSNGINVEAIRPLPFPGSLARPVYPQMNINRVDFTTHTHRGLGVGTKSHKPS
eukprot:scaffold3016_cov114-Skeletonema_dohrnii-CCMP3373.AAC.6